MNTSDFLTFCLALYGAIVSSILGLREISRDKRRILIFLEIVVFFERAQITITNTGFRPITLAEMNISIKNENQWEVIPRMVSIEDEKVLGDAFPLILTDGESISFKLHPVVYEKLLEGKDNIQVAIFDVEGNVYKKFKTRTHNPKWGYYEEHKK